MASQSTAFLLFLQRLGLGIFGDYSRPGPQRALNSKPYLVALFRTEVTSTLALLIACKSAGYLNPLTPNP